MTGEELSKYSTDITRHITYYVLRVLNLDASSIETCATALKSPILPTQPFVLPVSEHAVPGTYQTWPNLLRIHLHFG